MKLGLSIKNKVGGSSWTPDSISSLIHWYKHETGITTAAGQEPSNGDVIARWLDSKGDNNAAAEESNSTWNSTEKAIITSTNAGGLDLTPLNLTTFSVYCRIKFVDAIGTNDRWLLEAENASTNFMRMNNATSVRAKVGGTGVTYTVPTVSPGRYYNIGIERHTVSGTGTTKVFVDGTESSTGALNGTSTWVLDKLSMGKEDFFKTLIVCDGALTSDERAELNTYLDNI